MRQTGGDLLCDLSNESLQLVSPPEQWRGNGIRLSTYFSAVKGTGVLQWRHSSNRAFPRLCQGILPERAAALGRFARLGGSNRNREVGIQIISDD